MIECNPPTLSRQARLGNTIVLLEGLGQTGKGMVSRILSSFARVELERIEEVMESVSTLYQLKKITRDAAIVFLRTEADNHLINSMIGRNTNFRFQDGSSVWHDPHPWRYVRRLFLSKDTVLERIEKEQPIFQNMTHRQLANFDLYCDAFGERLRVVETIRHPVDLADTWMFRRFGNRYGEDPLSLAFCIRYQGHDVPYFALGWEDAYLSATPLERVIRMIEAQWSQDQATYELLSETQKNQIFFVPFEDFVQRPKLYLHPLAQFIGTKVTRRTRSVLRRENCPRTYSVSDRKRKQKSFEQQVSQEERFALRRLIEEYEALASKFVR